MTELLQQVIAEIKKLPAEQQDAIASRLMAELQDKQKWMHSTTDSLSERSLAIQRMRGLLKTEQPTPSDEEVAAMLEARLVEKYLK